MFRSPPKQWEKILTKPLKNQSAFLNKVCKVNKQDRLVIRSAFFEYLKFPLVRQIFDLVTNVVEAGGIDHSFKELIFDRLLWVSEIAHLYPVDKETEENIIFGESYHVYSACYYDLDLVINFINAHDDINSLCDLGSGTGRALLYTALMVDRELEYVGLELVNERVEFTNSIVNYFGLKNIFFKTCNFLECPEDFLGFDAYYLYDPVGTDDVSLLISHIKNMMVSGAKFYIIFVSGWDDLMLDALGDLENLKKMDSIKSHKQVDRFVNFYKCEMSKI